jgi:hypothetical protein
VRVNFRRWGVFNVVALCGFVVQSALLTRGCGWSSATAVGLELAALQNFLGTAFMARAARIGC